MSHIINKNQTPLVTNIHCYQIPPPQLIPFNQFSQPPPPITQNDNDTVQAAKEEQWLKEFLIQRNLQNNQIEVQKRLNSITIPEYQQKIIKINTLTKKLKDLEGNLKSESEKCSEFTWKVLTSEVKEIQGNLNSLIQTIEEDKPIIKKKILKLRKKRAGKEFQKSKLKLALEENLKKRKMAHEEIDQWMNKNSLALQKSIQEEHDAEYKREMLSDVVKRKMDAKKNLNVLANLVELRRLRKTAVQNTTLKESLSNDEDFNLNIMKSQKIWTDALHNYEKEEQALKKILVSILEPVKQIENEWNQALFGEEFGCKKMVNHPMLRAEIDYRSYLDIRLVFPFQIDKKTNV